VRDDVVQLASQPRTLLEHRRPRPLLALVLGPDGTRLHLGGAPPAAAHAAPGRPRAERERPDEGVVGRVGVGDGHVDAERAERQRPARQRNPQWALRGHGEHRDQRDQERHERLGRRTHGEPPELDRDHGDHRRQWRPDAPAQREGLRGDRDRGHGSRPLLGLDPEPPDLELAQRQRGKRDQPLGPAGPPTHRVEHGGHDATLAARGRCHIGRSGETKNARPADAPARRRS
jgi:hypothetical protein